MGLRVEVVRDGRLDDVVVAIRTVGGLVGATTEAAAAVGAVQAGLEAVRRRVAGRGRPRTLLVYGHRPLVVAAEDSYAGELLLAAGGANVVTEAEGYPVYSVERVLTAAPEVIVDVAMAPLAGPDEEAGQFWGRWASLPAVRNGRVHGLDSGPLMRPGPRAPLAAEALAALLHPEQAP